ncbi:MAG: ABC transporter ATP-binding protein, partial [Actinobacteria bacterium]|nr:ABC transporter ATP-binding protein [Actinomycetota bacterium]
MLLPGDADAVKGARMKRASLRRAWQFSSPYKWQIIGFLLAIVASALAALAPPLLFRAILDTAIPEGNRGLITTLAVILVIAAIADAGLAIIQRWLSSSIGEGLIYDLRVALFDKVQRMPIAFFTRTQTGALISRLNSDVVGAQTAVTSTLGSVVSNVVVLITTLAAMFVLEWRLTLLSLVVLPLFIAPAKRMGLKLGGIAREQMELNAQMNTQMSERFNVAGAMIVKLFGRREREVNTFATSASGVRDTGIKA